MAKKRRSFVCMECGYETPKWYGKCPSCGEFATIEESFDDEEYTHATSAVKLSSSRAKNIDDIDVDSEIRIKTNIKELDRVLGGGIVEGALMLIGGDPGIGKSTLLLQICGTLKGKNILYVSGEESLRQIKLRAERLGVKNSELSILSETDADTVIGHFKLDRPDIVIIDSIQTMHLQSISSSPGSITQVRECTSAIMRAAKTENIPVFVVSHVNKDGAIAGPKVMEHIVDCVMYFEGDRNSNYRMLRCKKNRYGSTNEIGVFEMDETGLAEVENPSMMLLSGRPKNVSGTCVACMIEGTRPLLAEVQGLVSPTAFGNPRRMSTGFDNNRLSLLLAVLEKRAGYFFSNLDAYINVVGGLKLDEPAADLPVAIALVSSLKDMPVSEDIVAFGEIGLAGEIRSISDIDSRISEAKRLGFKKIIIPKHNLDKIRKISGVSIFGVSDVHDAMDIISKEK